MPKYRQYGWMAEGMSRVAARGQRWKLARMVAQGVVKMVDPATVTATPPTYRPKPKPEPVQVDVARVGPETRLAAVSRRQMAHLERRRAIQRAMQRR